MEATDAILIGREAIWVLLKVAGPIMLVGLLTGLVVSFFQALTQMQEMTLAFVPKILVMFLSLMLLMPYMVMTLTNFTHSLMDKIVGM